ncbi:MAG: hypothetical protein LBP22_08830, partial [Deltaproteobacteria bacterium]|nr:hypothetical protein [Deltaproteobacteria bacterium]
MSPVAKKSARKVEVTLTQVESVSAAVKFLTGRGYKVSRSSFVSHLKAGLIAQDSRGCFKVKDLLAYAAVKLPPPLTEKTGAGLDLAQAKLREDTESRRLQNE